MDRDEKHYYILCLVRGHSAACYQCSTFVHLYSEITNKKQLAYNILGLVNGPIYNRPRSRTRLSCVEDHGRSYMSPSGDDFRMGRLKQRLHGPLSERPNRENTVFPLFLGSNLNNFKSEQIQNWTIFKSETIFQTWTI